MIPLRDANPTKRVPVVTLALVAANVAVFLLWQPSFGTELEQQTFYFCHAEVPYEVTHQVPLADSGAQGRTEIQEHETPTEVTNGDRETPLTRHAEPDREPVEPKRR